MHMNDVSNVVWAIRFCAVSAFCSKAGYHDADLTQKHHSRSETKKRCELGQTV